MSRRPGCPTDLISEGFDLRFFRRERVDSCARRVSRGIRARSRARSVHYGATSTVREHDAPRNGFVSSRLVALRTWKRIEIVILACDFTLRYSR